MKKRKKLRLIATVLLIFVIPLGSNTSAQATGNSVMGVQVSRLISYAIDLDRIYQGKQYDAAIKIGENLTFTGTLNEGLSDEMLQKFINEALIAEHLSREDVIETNKMIAELTQKMKNPQDFWAELDFYADLLDMKQYSDTIKHMAGSAMKPGEGAYKGLTAQEKQFVQEQLGTAMGESFDTWKSGLTGQAADKIKLNPDSFPGSAIGTAKIANKAYQVLSGVWKAMQRNIEQEKDLAWLKEMAIKRQLVLEAFYKRAGTLVKDYLKEYGQWQLRIDGAMSKEARVEQMTKLNFGRAEMDGSFSTFYTIQPIKLTWSADSYFIKDDHSENPNGTYSGRIKIIGEYDTSVLKEHLPSLVNKLEQYSLALNMTMYDESKIEAFERSKPSVKQVWRVDQCQIEILGLEENGAASIQLPELVLEKDITMDYEISGTMSVPNILGGTSTSTGYDQICTPEHTQKPIQTLPETWQGEAMDWVCLVPLEMEQQDLGYSYTYQAEMIAGEDNLDTAFIIRSPFDGFTGYKRLEITKAQ